MCIGQTTVQAEHPIFANYFAVCYLKYKKWDLSLFFQGVAKVSLMMSDIHPFSEAGHKGYNIAQYSTLRNHIKKIT